MLKTLLKVLLITSLLFVSLDMSAQTNVDDGIINKLLLDSLWSKRDIYDASHFLMVPLHYSFKNSKNTERFRKFFKRF